MRDALSPRQSAHPPPYLILRHCVPRRVTRRRALPRQTSALRAGSGGSWYLKSSAEGGGRWTCSAPVELSLVNTSLTLLSLRLFQNRELHSAARVQDDVLHRHRLWPRDLSQPLGIGISAVGGDAMERHACGRDWSAGFVSLSVVSGKEGESRRCIVCLDCVWGEAPECNQCAIRRSPDPAA